MPEPSDDGLTIARQRIAQEREQQTGFLDLCDLGLDGLPDEVFELTHLERLHVGSPLRYEDGAWQPDFPQRGTRNIVHAADLERVARMPALTALSVQDLALSDLTPLIGDGPLSWLDVAGTEVSDLSPLKQVPGLRHLDCRHAHVSDLWPLSHVNGLQYLDCWFTWVSDLSPLGHLTALQHLDCGDTQVLDLSPLAHIPGLQRLDCGATQVSDLSPLAHVTALQHLDCGATQVSDLSPLAHVTALQHLDCGATQVSDLSPLAHVTALQHLDCVNTHVSDLSPLVHLAGLQHVNCMITQVSDLWPLAHVAGLQHLYCEDTQVSDLTPLAHVTALQRLDCGNTHVSDLTPLAHVTALQHLDCVGTQVSDLSPLAQVTGLQHLYCGNTHVSDLTPLAHVTALQHLDCVGTQVSDLSPLAQVTGLRNLNCGRTQVSDLSPLVDLPWLKRLEANACSLLELPEALVWRPALEHLRLYGTEVPGVPPELLSQTPLENCLDGLRAHFDDLAHGAAEQADVKLLVLGNGGAGKTQLVRRLSGQPYDPAVPSTHGIGIGSVDVEGEGDRPPTRLNVWDFGGQDIYHGTHALFVRGRAVCLLVWTPGTERNETETPERQSFRNRPLRYWVDYVRHVVGADSPTLLVQTQCDHRRDGWRTAPVDDAALDAIAGMGELSVSAATDRGLEQLWATIREAVAELHERQGTARIGVGRLAVQRRIEALRNADGTLPPDWRFMHRETFDTWCAEDGRVSSPDQLLRYLHNAGVVFYRPDFLGGRIVLDHAWALDGIYAVFERERCYQRLVADHGRFSRPQLADLLWDRMGYSEADQRIFLEMMQACGICFVHRDPDADAPFGEAREYIAPDLLPPRERVATALAAVWGDGQGDAEARYTYSFLHPGLIRGLIARIGGNARQGALYWHGGVHVYERTTRSRALIEQEQAPGAWDGTLRVQTKGEQADTLLAHLKEMVEEENRRLGLDAEVADHPASGGAYVPATRARHDDAATDQQLAFGGEPFTYCVSYAWHEQTEEGRRVAAKVDEVCEAAKQRGETVLRDTEHLPLGESVSDFMSRIGAGQRVFVFLSDAYLRSPNCMYELYELWRNSGFDDANFRERIRVFVLPDAAIDSLNGRKQYHDFWKNYVQEQKRVIDELSDEGEIHSLPEKDFREYRMANEFAGKVMEILKTIQDTARPRSWQAFIDHGFGDPPDGR